MEWLTHIHQISPNVWSVQIVSKNLPVYVLLTCSVPLPPSNRPHATLTAVSGRSDLHGATNTQQLRWQLLQPNSLPVQLRSLDSTYGLFRRQLKAHLFREAWTLWRSVTLICSALEEHLLTYLPQTQAFVLNCCACYKMCVCAVAHRNDKCRSTASGGTWLSDAVSSWLSSGTVWNHVGLLGQGRDGKADVWDAAVEAGRVLCDACEWIHGCNNCYTLDDRRSSFPGFYRPW